MAKQPQIIRTPGGEELVVLPRAEYDDLVALAEDRKADTDEDAEDLAIAEARMAEFVAAGRHALPREVCEGMLRDESRLKAIRKWRGVKQGDLAQAIGIAQGYLSDLEGRRRKGTPETLRAVAKALDVPADWLLDADTPAKLLPASVTTTHGTFVLQRDGDTGLFLGRSPATQVAKGLKPASSSSSGRPAVPHAKKHPAG